MSTVPEQRRILIVDDERPLRDLVAGYLRREGYDVLAASDGPTALDIARASYPDLVILDVMLPGLESTKKSGGVRPLPALR